MARLKIRYLVEKPGRYGSRFFWQPSARLREQGWQSQRLAARIRDPEMARLAAIQEAEAINAKLDRHRKGETAEITGRVGTTVAALIAHYKSSPHYTRLRASTRTMYDENLRIIDRWVGDDPARAIDAPLVQEFYRQMQPVHPAKANNVVRLLRILYNHGRRHGLVEQNPAVRPKLIGLEFSGRLWPQSAIDAFVAAADYLGRHSIGTAVILNAWLGQREGDIIALPRSAYRNGELYIKQAKTGSRVTLPVAIVQRLQARLSAELIRQGDKKLTATTLIISETTGQGYKRDNFRHLFKRIRDKAIAGIKDEQGHTLLEPSPALEGLHFKHLRHTAIVALAEANCSHQLICSVSGHQPASVGQILKHYWQPTSEQAAEAFRRRLAKERD